MEPRGHRLDLTVGYSARVGVSPSAYFMHAIQKGEKGEAGSYMPHPEILYLLLGCHPGFYPEGRTRYHNNSNRLVHLLSWDPVCLAGHYKTFLLSHSLLFSLLTMSIVSQSCRLRHVLATLSTVKLHIFTVPIFFEMSPSVTSHRALPSS